MRIEVGAPVVLVRGVDDLWHLPAERRLGRELPLADAEARGLAADWPTLCGLPGDLYRFVPFLRNRRLCAVCRTRAPILHPALPPSR